MKTIITTDQAPKAVGPYSQAVQAGGFMFCSGQIPLDPVTGEKVGVTIEEQTHQVMKNIKGLLASQGLGFEHIVKSTAFLTNMANFAAFNPIYAEYFAGEHPARSTVEVSRLPLDVLVEVEVVVLLP